MANFNKQFSIGFVMAMMNNELHSCPLVFNLKCIVNNAMVQFVPGFMMTYKLNPFQANKNKLT